MRLYIDPGTGSMLFAVLIGLIGAARYGLKVAFTKLKFKVGAGKNTNNGDTLPFVIFSDDKRYWKVFEPIVKELSRRHFETVYYTLGKDDKALEANIDHFRAKYLGDGNKGFTKLNFLKADLVLSTTPGLDVLQWKRSKEVKHYMHITHSTNEIAGYHMFGIDYYDSIMLSGEYEIKDVRDLETLRNLPAKELKVVGVPYLDEDLKRLEKEGRIDNKEKVVLLAPSWGLSSILARYGGRIIEQLLNTGYHIIIRPHPQSLVSETKMIEDLMQQYPESQQLEWNRDSDNFEVLRRADIMISDYSGVAFDYSLLFDKPLLYQVSNYDDSQYDVWWLKRELWTFGALRRIGMSLDEDKLDHLKDVIDTLIDDEKYQQGRDEVRREGWANVGQSACLAADFIMEKYQEITKEVK